MHPASAESASIRSGGTGHRSASRAAPPDRKHLRRPLRVGHARKHAVGVREMLGQHHGLSILQGAEPHKVVAALHQGSRLAVDRAMPQAFALDVRIESKKCAGRKGITQVDAVAIRIAAKSELEALRLAAGERLDGMRTLSDAPRDGLRPGPQGGRQAALAGQRGQRCVLGHVCQEPERTVDARFAAAVGSGNQAELPEGSAKDRRERYPSMAIVRIMW